MVIQGERTIGRVTADGLKAFHAFPDPEAFYKEAVRLYHQWKATQPEDIEETAEDESEGTTAKIAVLLLKKEQAWSEIDQYLRGLNPYEFQEIVAALLRAMGHHISWIAPPGTDGGIDILAASDPLGTRPPRIKGASQTSVAIR